MFNQTKKNYFIENLKQIYSSFLDESILNFDYYIEEDLYCELDIFKNKKIFPRTHFVKLNNNSVKYKINEGISLKKELYIEEIIYILKMFVLNLNNYKKNEKYVDFNVNDYINNLYNYYDVEFLECTPFVKIEINNSIYYEYSNEIEVYLNSINFEELKNLEILLTGIDSYCIEVFFKNFSYFKPKNLKELNWNEKNNLLPLLNLSCDINVRNKI